MFQCEYDEVTYHLSCLTVLAAWTFFVYTLTTSKPPQSDDCFLALLASSLESGTAFTDGTNCFLVARLYASSLVASCFQGTFPPENLQAFGLPKTWQKQASAGAWGTWRLIGRSGRYLGLRLEQIRRLVSILWLAIYISFIRDRLI